MKKTFHNILGYTFANIGDVLLTTSAVALLRKNYPQAKITMMVRPFAEELMKNNPLIDEIILVDYKSKKNSFRKMLEMVKTVKNKKFDLAISFDRKSRPAIIAFLAGIPVRVGPEKVFDDKKSHVTMLYTHTIPITHNLQTTLQADTYQAIVNGFTGIQRKAKPIMAIPRQNNIDNAKNLLATLPPHNLRIALCVKGTFPLKDWPKNYFATLIDTLALQYPKAAFFIIGAPGDKSYSESIRQLSHAPIEIFCGKTSLTDLIPLLNQSDLFITVDTGALHIAATTDIPIVAIFGCTSPQRWHPQSERTAVLYRNLPCSACSYPADGCPNEHACMDTITVEEVFSAAKKCLVEYKMIHA
jgi:lipopolysaccharide heptosyltransferase II